MAIGIDINGKGRGALIIAQYSGYIGPEIGRMAVQKVLSQTFRLPA